MKEPIQHFFNHYGFNKNEIKSFIAGEKYVGITLQNGNIGVCSTLNQNIVISPNTMKEVLPDNLQHRIILNAYYNAKFNYENKYEKIIDIFNAIDFKKYDRIVMIGFFRSLVKKFQNENIPLTIFDKIEEDALLTDMKAQQQFITEAKCVILSGTTIFNNTFLNIVNSTANDCDVFLLGPSNILHADMFNYKNIKVAFGSVFNQNDPRIFEKIKAGGGTPSFLDFLKKVYLTRDNIELSL